MIRSPRTHWQALRQYGDDFFLVLDTRRSLPELLAVAALMLVAGLLDLIGVGLVAPFVAMVVGQDISALPPLMVATARRLDLETLGTIIVVVFAVKSVFAYRLQRRIVSFSEGHRARLMTRVLERYL